MCAPCVNAPQARRRRDRESPSKAVSPCIPLIPRGPAAAPRRTRGTRHGPDATRRLTGTAATLRSDV